MDILKTDINGGFPIVLDDIRQVLQVIQNSITGLGRLNGYTTYIIDGVTFPDDPTGLSHAAGVMMLNGEVCAVDAVAYGAGVSHADLSLVYWVKDTTYNAAGSKVFQDGATHDTYVINKAKLILVSGSLPAGAYPITSTLSIGQLMSALIARYPLVMQNRLDFAKGASAIMTGTIVNLSPLGNVSELDISGGVSIGGVSCAANIGSTMRLYLTGSSGSVCDLFHSSTLYTPGGLSYIYKVGDFIEFVQLYNGVWALVDSVNNSDSGWQSVPALVNGFTSGTRTLQVRRRGNLLYFRGIINPASGVSATGAYLISTLSTDFRPVSQSIVPIISIDVNHAANMAMSLYANGDILIMYYGAAWSASFDGIVIPLD